MCDVGKRTEKINAKCVQVKKMDNVSPLATNSRVFWEIPKPKKQAAHRLFCFPFSGGSPQYFREWCDLVPDTLEICILSAPGKGRRVTEAPVDSMDELVDQILSQKSIFQEKEFSFFGHSMGAWVAAETCWQLLDQGCALPRQFIVSGSIPLCFKRLPPYVHQMTDDDLINELKILGGTPEELLNDRKFISSFLPGIRADFKIFELHTHRHSRALPVNLSIWSGIDDPRVPVSLGQYWKMIVQGKANESFFPGGHMFIDAAQSRSECLDELSNLFEKVPVF